MAHHCPGGRHAFDRSRCPKKGHVVQCPVHLDIYSAPGQECETCIAIEEAQDRKEKKKKEAEEKNKRGKGT